jgi:hypothetical protein
MTTTETGFCHYGIGDDPMARVREGEVVVSIGRNHQWCGDVALDDGEELIYLGVQGNPSGDGKHTAALLTAEQTARLISELASTLALMVKPE